VSFAALRDDRRSFVGSCRSVRPFAPAVFAWTLARAVAFPIARPAFALTRRADITLVVTRRDVLAVDAHE
jgi:hypothetical protein